MNTPKIFVVFLLTVFIVFTDATKKYHGESLENITEDMASDFKLEARHERNSERLEAQRIEHRIKIVKEKIRETLKKARSDVISAKKNMHEVDKISVRSRHEIKKNRLLMTKFLADMTRIKQEHQTWLQRFETNSSTNRKLAQDLDRVSRKQVVEALRLSKKARTLGKGILREKKNVNEMVAEVRKGGQALEQLGSTRTQKNFNDLWDDRLRILEAEDQKVEGMRKALGREGSIKRMQKAFDNVSRLESARQRLDNSIVDLSSQMRSLEEAIIRSSFGEASSGRGNSPSDMALRLLSDMEDYRVMISSQFAQAHADYLEFCSDVAVELFAQDFKSNHAKSSSHGQIASAIREEHGKLDSMVNMEATNTTLRDMESVLKGNLVANRVESIGEEYSSPLRNQLDAVTSLIDDLVSQSKKNKAGH